MQNLFSESTILIIVQKFLQRCINQTFIEDLLCARCYAWFGYENKYDVSFPAHSPVGKSSLIPVSHLNPIFTKFYRLSSKNIQCCWGTSHHLYFDHRFSPLNHCNCFVSLLLPLLHFRTLESPGELKKYWYPGPIPSKSVFLEAVPWRW